ncbi:MAG: hypothetical protein A2138_09315 [Deltaproteobacteria bacterium RBG_16_71_12]|nr:MAG: hypothetical protein A2138_09315 [Deltaproteobacteria bacterium RBG_16_71_12]
MSYYVTSLPPEKATKIVQCVRGRWGIENRLHYVLDVAFDEDGSRVRSRNAPESLARMRHIAFNLIKACKRQADVSLGVKRILAATDNALLAGILRVK